MIFPVSLWIDWVLCSSARWGTTLNYLEKDVTQVRTVFDQAIAIRENEQEAILFESIWRHDQQTLWHLTQITRHDGVAGHCNNSRGDELSVG